LAGTAGVGRTPALICDTGAILDYLVRDAPDHRRFRAAIDGARARYIPGLVLAEVDYFLRNEREAMRAFVDDLTTGAFTYAAPTSDRRRHRRRGAPPNAMRAPTPTYEMPSDGRRSGARG
jgi:glutathione S-transferase